MKPKTRLLVSLLGLAFILAAGATLFGGCVEADLNVQQVMVQHNFTSPNDIPGCSPSLEVYFPCPTVPVTVNLPGFTQKINFKPPSGVTADVYVDRIDITSPSGASFDFIQGIIIEISGDHVAQILVDYTPSVPPGQDLTLFPDDTNLLKYVEGDATTFTIAITGTVPPAEVPLDVTIFLNGSVSVKKGL